MVASTPFEHLSFLTWFAVDFIFVMVAISIGHREDREAAAGKALLGNLALLVLYWILSLVFLDHHASAWFTAFTIQGYLSWGSVHDLMRNKSTKGHSLEIW